MSDQPPLFVLSSGRTGSTLLAKLLHRHPEICCVSDLFEPVGREPYFDASRVVDGRGFFSILSRPSYPQRIRYWRHRSTAELLFLPDEDAKVSLLLSYTLPFVSEAPLELLDELEGACLRRGEAPVPVHLIWFFGWLRDRCGKRFWVERTGGSLPHTERIVDTWPGGRFVHNVRDTRETAISMMKGSFFRLYLELEKDPDLGDWDWEIMPPLDEMGAMLARWILSAEEVFDRLPAEQRLTLRYEDLGRDPEATLLELVTFLLARDDPTAADRRWASEQAGEVRPAPPKFPDLPEGEQRRLEAAVGEALERLGYR